MEATTGTIFINYRKDDSSWNALALYNELLKYFVKEQIFKDFNTILPGDDFTISIQNALAKCDILLVVIGKGWLDMKDAKGNRRLDEPDDFVRIEIATALERNIQVIPVLFDNVPMPSVEQLPASLRGLTRRQYKEIETQRFEDDVRNLAEAIKKVLSSLYPNGEYRPAPPVVPSKPVYAQQSKALPPIGEKPDNFLVWAILTTVLCCLPLGIVAILNASKVDSLWSAGKHDEARQMAVKAKRWAVYAAIAGIVSWVLYFVIMGAGVIDSGY